MSQQNYAGLTSRQRPKMKRRLLRPIIAVQLITLFFLVVCASVYHSGRNLRYVSDYVPKSTVYENIFHRSVNLTVKLKRYHRFIKNQGSISGTGWILDYEVCSSSRYPLVFYYATNVHIACFYDLKLCHVSLKTGMVNPEGLIKREEEFFPKEVRLIYSGLNFIKRQHLKKLVTSMKIYYTKQTKYLYFSPVRKRSQRYHWGNADQINWLDYLNHPIAPMIDFAVIRVVFRSHRDAVRATHDFVNKPPKTKFWKHDLDELNNLSQKRWFLGGYPNGRWTINSIVKEKKSRAFLGKPLASSVTFNSSYSKGIFRSKTFAWRQGKIFYIPYGIQLVLNKSALGKGSSGSLICDEDNQLVGINWGRFKNEQTCCLHVLINHANYVAKIKNEYGQFEQVIINYNLIYQNAYSTSYQEALHRRYPKVSTALFPRLKKQANLKN